MGQSNQEPIALSKIIVSIVSMILAVIVVLYALEKGLCDQNVIILLLLLLFGGEQVAKAWIETKVKNGEASTVPTLLLEWYKKTEGVVALGKLERC